MTDIVVSMTPEAARALTDNITAALEMTWEMVAEAYRGRAWEALGYPSWAAYCEVEFQTSRLRLPRSERAEVVVALTDAGMSVREIAAATGASKSTVARELSPAVPFGTRVTSDLACPVCGGTGSALFPDCWFDGRCNPTRHLGAALSDEGWAACIAEGRRRAEDDFDRYIDVWSYWASVDERVFDAALALCRATGDLSPERVTATIAAALA